MNDQGIVWAEPRPKADPLDEFWDVIPIPFYPDDLPVLEITPMPAEHMLATARLARRWLWVAPPTQNELAA